MRPRLCLACLLFPLAVLSGCATLEVQTVSRPGWPHSLHDPDCELTVHGIDDAPDPSCVEIGDVFVGDTGLTTNCGLARVIETVRSEACRYGADAAQIVRHQPPSFLYSTCDQVRARFLECGDGANR